jgi:hypothetical protein
MTFASVFIFRKVCLQEKVQILEMSISDKSKELDYGLEYGYADACTNNGQRSI